MTEKRKVKYNQNEDIKPFDKKEFYPGDIPQKPGVYLFRDRFSKVIYVGKAVNLRKRMSSYFQPSRKNTADPKLRSLIKSICYWEFYPVKNESESLILEARMIKDYSPRYNVLLRDDKRFLLVKINLKEKFPGLHLARLRKNDGSRYFGPFPQSGALRKTVDFLVKRFGLRVCRPSIPGEKEHKHCLASIVKDCCEPCVGKTSPEEYMERVEGLMKILNGSVSEIVCEIREKMGKAVEKKRFENAALFRDMIENIEEIFGNRNRSFRFAKIAGAEDAEKALSALGEVLGIDPPKRIEAFDISNISGSLAVASMVCFIDGKAETSQYRRFRMRAGGRELRSEDRDPGSENTEEEPRSENRDPGSENTEERISNIQHGISNDQLKSTDSGPRATDNALSDYPYGKGGDDFAMMQEAVSRRYGKRSSEFSVPSSELGNTEEKEEGVRCQVSGNIGEHRTSNVQLPTSNEEVNKNVGASPCGRPNLISDIQQGISNDQVNNTDNGRRSTENGNKIPDLILIDGGKGQLNAAMKVLKMIDHPFVPVIGLAKKNEEIFIPGRQLPIILDKHSPALRLLQSVRDEAHRFAVAYHRKLRDSRIENSILDQIDGVGPSRKKALLKAFGSVKKLRKATPEQICAKVPGIGAKFAATICDGLKK